MSRTVVYKIVDHIRKELGQYGIKLSKIYNLAAMKWRLDNILLCSITEFTKILKNYIIKQIFAQ